MAIKPTLRRNLSIGLLLLGGGLLVERMIALAGDADQAGVAVAVAGDTGRAGDERPAPRDNRPATLHLNRLDERQTGGGAEPPRSWTLFNAAAPAHATEATPPPPPPPRAPPFPYPYVGGLTDGASRTAFFARGNDVLMLHQGDSVDGAWRVDLLNETRMTITYLPLSRSIDINLAAPQ